MRDFAYKTPDFILNIFYFREFEQFVYHDYR